MDPRFKTFEPLDQPRFLFLCGPRGFKLDRPAVPAYRSRLTALTQSIASDIEANPA